jgi:hypothetical protein
LLKATDFPSNPYAPEYLDILKEVKSGTFSLESLIEPKTTEDEAYAKVLRDGIHAKRLGEKIRKRAPNVAAVNCKKIQHGVEKLKEIVSI